MITDEDPLRGLFSTRISVSLTHYMYVQNSDGGAKTPISGKRALVGIRGGRVGCDPI